MSEILSVREWDAATKWVGDQVLRGATACSLRVCVAFPPPSRHIPGNAISCAAAYVRIWYTIPVLAAGRSIAGSVLWHSLPIVSHIRRTLSRKGQRILDNPRICRTFYGERRRQRWHEKRKLESIFRTNS